MSGFSPKQVQSLRRRLDRRHVQTREVEGRSIDYVEGWFAIKEANAIFGFDGWDREMTHFERLYERSRNDRTNCGYLARVRIRVRACDNIVVREGTGWGSASAANPADAHERALKAAETDATKRALATFGNRFGLGLYDKEQNGVTPKKPVALATGSIAANRFCLHEPVGAPLAEGLSAEGFCTGLRQLIEAASPAEVEALLRVNEQGLARLRRDAPNLKTNKGAHYADVLERLAKDRIKPPQRVTEDLQSSEPIPDSKPSQIAPGVRIDKSELSIGEEKRYRDKEHLKFVAAQPCLICGRQPSHAHHVKFAQPRGLSIKVSDEFTVPLCAIHHDELHRSGLEKAWWEKRGLDPLATSAQLWLMTRRSATAEGQGCLDTTISVELPGDAPSPRLNEPIGV